VLLRQKPKKRKKKLEAFPCRGEVTVNLILLTKNNIRNEKNVKNAFL